MQEGLTINCQSFPGWLIPYYKLREITKMRMRMKINERIKELRELKDRMITEILDEKPEGQHRDFLVDQVRECQVRIGELEGVRYMLLTEQL